MTLRKLLLTTHLYIGMMAAPFLAVVGLTGAILVFEEPLDQALNARLLRTTARGPVLPLAELDRRLEAAHPGYRAAGVTFPGTDGIAYAVDLAADGRPDLNLFVDPHDARVLGTAAEQRTLLGKVHQAHTRLLAGQPGRTIVGWTGVLLVLLSLSGLVLWWPGKILWVHRTGTGRRIVFELHNMLGGLCWLFLLGFGLTGMVIHWNGPTLQWASRLGGTALPGPFPDSASGCTGAAGAAPLPLDRIIDVAVAAMPGARVTAVHAPDRKAARVIMKYPEDHTPAGRTNVFVDGCSGQILDARNARTAPTAYRAVAMWNREIHTGDLWGWPTRLLACLVSLALPVMALTGPLMWWSKRRRRARRTAITTPAAREVATERALSGLPG